MSQYNYLKRSENFIMVIIGKNFWKVVLVYVELTRRLY